MGRINRGRTVYVEDVILRRAIENRHRIRFIYENDSKNFGISEIRAESVNVIYNHLIGAMLELDAELTDKMLQESENIYNKHTVLPKIKYDIFNSIILLDMDSEHIDKYRELIERAFDIISEEYTCISENIIRFEDAIAHTIIPRTSRTIAVYGNDGGGILYPSVLPVIIIQEKTNVWGNPLTILHELVHIIDRTNITVFKKLIELDTTMMVRYEEYYEKLHIRDIEIIAYLSEYLYSRKITNITTKDIKVLTRKMINTVLSKNLSVVNLGMIPEGSMKYMKTRRGRR